MALVPGRECGSCGVCCEVPDIDDTELQKAAGVVCPHYDKIDGCTIYRTRPQICRDYYCGWRTMASLDDNWRPDRSDVFITAAGEDIPERYRERGALKLVLRLDHTLTRPPFVDLICTMVEKGIPIYLTVPGPIGHRSAKILANTDLAAPVREHDTQRVANVVAGMFKGLAKFAAKTPAHRHRSP